MTTRAEHVKWCKERALEYLKENDLQSAAASMLSDLGKHEETASMVAGPLGMLGLMEAASGNPQRVRRFIEGFAE